MQILHVQFCKPHTNRKKMSNIPKLIGILGDLQFDTCFKSSAKNDNIIKKEQ